MRRREDASRGYVEVKTPLIYDKVLWERSGHWEKFRENMFLIPEDDHIFAIKPMNCPGHMVLFAEHPAELPRAAAALRGGGAAAPQRAGRHAARAHPGAARDPGRRAHLLHPRADRGRDLRLPRLREVHLRPLRPRIQLRAVDPAGEPARERRGVGLHRGSRSGPPSNGEVSVRAQRGRRRLLRPEDRPPHARLARPLLGRWAPSSSTASSRRG